MLMILDRYDPDNLTLVRRPFLLDYPGRIEDASDTRRSVSVFGDCLLIDFEPGENNRSRDLQE